MSEAAAASAAASSAPAAPAEPPPPPLGLKGRFARFTERFGHMMSRVILTVLYVGLVAPAGIVLSLLGDPLRIRRWSGTAWSDWTRDNSSLERARRQD